MKRVILAVALLVLPAGVIAQTDMDTRTKEIALETAQANLDKARASAFDPIRATSGGTTVFANPEKSTEGVMLRNAVYAGLSRKMAEDFKGLRLSSDVKPLIVVGSTPPTVAHWLAFENQRAHIYADIAAANGEWEAVKGDKCSSSSSPLFVPIVAAAVAATIINGIKTDYNFGGATLTETPSDVEIAVAEALPANSVSLQSYAVNTDGKKDANALLQRTDTGKGQRGGLTEAVEAARQYYTKGYLVCLQEAGGKPEKISSAKKAASGSVLKSLLDSYDQMEKQLFVETNGVIAATVIEREEQRIKTPEPVIYITAHEAALTAMTKKNLLTGWAIPGTKFTAVGTMTYVFAVPGKPPVRNSLSCLIENKTLADIRSGKESNCQIAGS